MAGGVFAVSVVTPERVLFSGEVTAVVARSSDGGLTVLDGHTPLVTDLLPGRVRVERVEAEPLYLAVHGGYLQVDKQSGGRAAAGTASPEPGTTVTLLAGVAELAEEIDAPRAQAALEQARQQVDRLRVTGAREGARGPVVDAGDELAPALTPEDLELAEAEAALRRAEVRLDVAGVAI